MRTFRDLVSDYIDIITEIDLTERKYFSGRKIVHDKAKRINHTDRRVRRRKAQYYYRKNKAHIRKIQRLYRYSHKASPSVKRVHRKNYEY